MEYNFSSIRAIRKDNFSGSSLLLRKLIHNIKSILQKESSDEVLEKLYIDLELVNKDLGHFAVIAHFVNFVKTTSNGNIEDLLRDISNYNKQWDNKIKKLVSQFATQVNFNDKIIFLHSYSGLIGQLFNQLKKQKNNCMIIQTESRPVNEGIMQAEFIGDLGFPVQLITDGAMGTHLKKCDVVILGADSVYENCFINKTGSFPLVVMAKEFGIPVYVLAESRKHLIGTLAKAKFSKASSKEIYAGENDNISVVNEYFESIPIEYVKEFISEK